LRLTLYKKLNPFTIETIISHLSEVEKTKEKCIFCSNSTLCNNCLNFEFAKLLRELNLPDNSISEYSKILNPLTVRR